MHFILKLQKSLYPAFNSGGWSCGRGLIRWISGEYTLFLEYLTNSINVSRHQTCRDFNFVFQRLQRTNSWCAQRSSTAAEQNSQLHFFWAVDSWNLLTTTLRQSYSNVSMICSSTLSKKWSIDWLNYGKTLQWYILSKTMHFDVFKFRQVVQKH